MNGTRLIDALCGKAYLVAFQQNLEASCASEMLLDPSLAGAATCISRSQRNAALMLLTSEGAPMNLLRAQKALLTIQRHQHRHLRVRRAVNQADVREMVREGLVSATPGDSSRESATVLRTLTDAGRRFLEMFPPRFRFCDAR